jgi:hypothetical protein
LLGDMQAATNDHRQLYRDHIPVPGTGNLKTVPFAARETPATRMPMLTPAARLLADQLDGLGTDEVMALAIPPQRQDDRARALDHYASVLNELRGNGWTLDTGVRQVPGSGLVVWVAPTARPPEEDPCP